MDHLRVQKLKKRYPVEAAQLKGTPEEAGTGKILAMLDLDGTLGFGAMEFVETMSGESSKTVYSHLIGVICKFSDRVDEMFVDLTEEEKQHIKQLVRSVT